MTASPAQIAVRFTASNARELQRRAVAARLANRDARKRAEQEAKLASKAQAETAQLQPQLAADPIAERIARTLEAKLTLLDSADEPRDIAQLARAVRELRETYHLVTGLARPGLSRTDAKPAGGLWSAPPVAPPSSPTEPGAKS